MLTVWEVILIWQDPLEGPGHYSCVANCSNDTNICESSARAGLRNHRLHRGTDNLDSRPTSDRCDSSFLFLLTES